MQTRICHHARHSRHRGFSLVELLIVMAVLAAVAGLTLPAMRGPLDKSRLTSAARQVQATLAKARALAIRESAVVQFRYEIAGGRFVIERLPLPQQISLTVLDDAGGMSNTPSGLTEAPSQPVNTSTENNSELTSLSGPAAIDGNGDIAGPVILREGELPPGVTFASPVTAESSDTALPGSAGLTSEVATSSAQPMTSVPRWSEPVLFQPTGRTSDRVIRLNSQRDFFVEVTLRGLTATASYSAPMRVALATSYPGAAAEAATAGAVE